MRKLSRLMAGTVTMAAAAALVAGTVATASAAPNDPPKGVTPAAYDIVGVGSNTTENVIDQIAVGYDAGVKDHGPAHPYLFSWDALPPGVTVAAPGVTYKITPKKGCSAIDRPNGSSSGVTGLNDTALDGKTGFPCLDFARSSGGRKPTQPAFAPGGITFVAFAKDAITWAVRGTKGGSDAPKTLDTAQLKSIFACDTKNWDKVGGKAGAIKVYLPQAGSGTLSTWEKFMGLPTSGPLPSCISQAPEENEGTFKGFNSANAIFIYSIGAYVAQKYHSAACGAKPTRKQNEFGCNDTGYLTLGKIGGVSPLSSAKVPTINPKFPKSYWRTLYNVVNYATGTKDHISKKLEGIFGSTGYLCKSPAAKKAIVDYGFVVTPLCGSTD
jgi:ABC-type phosphate transport system substrate-binding protein